MKHIYFAKDPKSGLVVKFESEHCGDLINMLVSIVNPMLKDENGNIYFEDIKLPEFIGDMMCNCNCGSFCPLGKTGMGKRCTKREFSDANVKL
jgi:hypothetical protein